MISIGGFIRNDQWIYSKQRIRIRRWGDWLIDSSLTIQGRNMTYTQNRSKKLLKNKNMCTIYIFFIQAALSLSSNFLFQQCHCQKSNNFFSFSFYFSNAIATNSFPQFFSPLFRQCHCHKPIATKKIFPPILAMPLSQIHSHNI